MAAARDCVRNAHVVVRWLRIDPQPGNRDIAVDPVGPDGCLLSGRMEFSQPLLLAKRRLHATAARWMNLAILATTAAFLGVIVGLIHLFKAWKEL